jgi:SAM-dependent methyltransferase
MFSILREHLTRPGLFSQYSAKTLWTDDHISSRMLEYHLDPSGDIASRNHTFIQRAVSWMAHEFDLAGRTVLDMGCGPGLYALELARSGAHVYGIDFSPRSIQQARTVALDAGLDVDFELGDYLEYDPHRTFDLVCLIYGDYCALNPHQRGSLMRNVRRWLRGGGSLLLDVFSMAHFDAVAERTSFDAYLESGFWSAHPHFVFRTLFKYQEEGAYLDRYLVVEEATHWEVFNWIQCFNCERLEEELASAGLHVVRRLGSVAGDTFEERAPEFAVEAKPVRNQLT